MYSVRQNVGWTMFSLMGCWMDVEIRQKEMVFFHLPWNCKILIRIRRARVQEDIKNRFLNICKF
jgi:hypothetical protein